MAEDRLEFTATGPWEKEVNGIIKLEEDIATVTILGQTWLDFSSINEYKFYKTSDIPNIFELELEGYGNDNSGENAHVQ